jgi:Bacterial Ig-like domain
VNPARALSISSQGYGVFLYVAGIGQQVAVTYSVSPDLRTVIVTPTAPLQAGMQYQLLAHLGITDLAGNQFPASVSIFFTTQ